MHKTIQLSLLSVALLSQLHASNAFTLGTINVTAAQGTTLKKKDVTDDVTIITKEQIQDSRVTTLNEALNKLGNISISQNGGVGTASTIYVRGMSSKRVLVLIDGIRYNNPTAIGAAAEFSQIMLDNVERIEIIKGAQSGVWGSDASGGVINIITSKAKKGTHASIHTEYGSYNTAKTSVHASYANEKLRMNASSLLYTTDGFSAAEPFKGDANYGKRYDEIGYEKDPYINRTYNFDVAYNFTKHDSISARANIVKSIVHYDASAFNAAIGGYVSSDSPIPQTTLFNRYYQIGFNHKDSINDIKLNYNLSEFNRDIIGVYGTYKYDGSVNELKLEDKITYSKNSFVRVGGSYQKFEQKDITPNTTKNYNAKSLFATNYNKLDLFINANTILTESLRYDAFNAFDNAFTGKVGIKQFLKNNFYISMNAGTGYNAPTLGQLYGQFGANPNLKPEKTLTTDLTIGNDTLWITGFYNEIKDLIDYQYPAGYVQLTGKSKLKGLELGFENYFSNDIGIKALYTYLRTEDAQGKTLARRPINQLDLTASYYLSENVDFSTHIQYVGTRYDKADNKGAQTGKYATADLVANMKASKKLSFYAKINNITDKYYQTVDGYATAGRSVYVGLVAKY